MSEPLSWLWLIPALPLLGSVVAGTLHFITLHARRADPEARGTGDLAAFVAVAAVALSCAVAVLGFLRILPGSGVEALTSTSWDWIHVGGGLRVEVALVLDRLSGAMALVVTGVGLLIHIYAAGYMKGDPGYAKFFAYLNLFVAAMLMLILSGNLVGMFVGWEGVGLCSYLLIGFWYTKQGGWPALAGQKAFVMNRIGDASFLLGMFLLFDLFSTLDLSLLNARAGAAFDAQQHGGAMALAALLLFGGACGKSAQIPLFTWLPDAMAGPTPVSALIHAATMVTSGIYLVIRLNPLFAASGTVLTIIACVGAATALVAGSTALVQRDLKGILAYSTISQLGFMFLALGTGAWVAALFHLITHAFFKALLFLGAGSVIHGVHGEQDVHRMGGLKRYMPRTFWTFTAGAAALSGLPLLSGFFSKDEILAHVFARGGVWILLWAVGLFTAALTAAYSWRMVALVFFGPERFDPAHPPHESPKLMTLPLVALAVLAIVGGALGLPHVFHVPHLLKDWLEPVVAAGDRILEQQHFVGHLGVVAEWVLLALGSAVALGLAHWGFHAHRHGTGADEALAAERPELVGALSAAWGVDRAYSAWVVAPVKLLAVCVAVVVDQLGIDSLVDGCAKSAKRLGTRLKGMADGSIATYGLWMGGVTAGIALIWMWMGV